MYWGTLKTGRKATIVQAIYAWQLHLLAVLCRHLCNIGTSDAENEDISERAWSTTERLFKWITLSLQEHFLMCYIGEELKFLQVLLYE